MKKLFTILMAFAMVSIAFAQKGPQERSTLIPNPVQNTNHQRSGWFGCPDQNYVTNLTTSQLSIVTFPLSGTLTPGTTIEKVKFVYFDGRQINIGTDEEPVMVDPNPNFTIKIFTGGDLSWMNEETTYTFDEVGGTLAYSQAYVADDNFNQEVTLTNPFTVPADGNVWVAVENEAATIFGIMYPEDGQGNVFEYPQGASLHDGIYQDQHYYECAPAWWGDAGHTFTVNGSYFIQVFVNDGQVYQPTCDWNTVFYTALNPTDERERLTELVIDEDYTDLYDSLYIRMGAFNSGPDDFTGKASVRLYIAQTQNPTEEECIDFFSTDDDLWYQFQNPDDGDDPVNSGYGSIWGSEPASLALWALTDMVEAEFVYPYYVHFEVRTDAGEPDPNLDNNHAIMAVTDVPSTGIANNTNNTVSVYPNPANNMTTISNEAGAEIAIFNLAGQNVMTINNANANATIDVTNLTVGAYIIRVTSDTKTSTAKLNIVR